MIARRTFLASLAGGLLAGERAAATEPGRTLHRIGFVGNSTAALESNLVEPWRQGLRELGYVDGRDIVVEYRWAEGHYERFPTLIRELVALKVEVLVAAGTPAALAVKRTAPAIALVMVAVGDPVGTGLVTSLARPGGNLTGLVSIAPDLEGKRLELLGEIVPRLGRVVLLVNPANPFHTASEAQVRAAAEIAQVKVRFVAVGTEAEFEPAFATIARDRPGALIMLADRLFLHHRHRIVEFAARTRIPAVYPYREMVEAGGLMSFGPSYSEMHRRAAYFVDKILKGARPGDLPMEQPSKFELMLNLKAARALHLTIPAPVLLRADRVIE
jgi:putative tryptophan/tyrosine transport system substrate-binding protein